MSGQSKLPFGSAWNALWRGLLDRRPEPPPRQRADNERCDNCLNYVHHHQDDVSGQCRLRLQQADLFDADGGQVSAIGWCEQHQEYRWHD